MRAVYSSDEVAISCAIRWAKANPSGWLGPFFMATAIDSYFFGLLCCQVLTYRSRFPNDSRWNKTLVALCLVLSFLKVIESSWGIWITYVAGFADWRQAVSFEWSRSLEPTTMVILATTAQMYFAWRCFILTGRNWPLLIFLATAMLSIVVLGILFSIQLFYDPFHTPIVKRIASPMLVLGVVVDVVITFTVLRKLITSRKTLRKRAFLDKWIAITCQSALPPALCQLMTVVFFAFEDRRGMWHVMLNMVTPRLYVFSLMYTLNSRVQSKPPVGTAFTSRVSPREKMNAGTSAGVEESAAMTTLSAFQPKCQASSVEIWELSPLHTDQSNAGKYGPILVSTADGGNGVGSRLDFVSDRQS